MKTKYFLLMAAFACMLCSCGDENTPDGDGSGVATGDQRLVKKVTTRVEGRDYDSETYEFNYDSKGRIASFRTQEVYKDDFCSEVDEYTVKVTYGKNTISYAGNGISGSASLNANGLVISGKQAIVDVDDPEESEKSEYAITYNEAGQLVKSVSKETDDDGNTETPEVTTITWAGKNPVKCEWGNEYQTTCTDRAEYGETINPQTSVDLNFLCCLMVSEGWNFAAGHGAQLFSVMGINGMRSEKLATKVITHYDGPQSFEYTLDAKGYPTSITIIEYSSNGSVNGKTTCTITYVK